MTYAKTLNLNFRLVERYLVDGFTPQRLSTYALNLFRHRMTISEEKVLIGMRPN